MLFGEFIKAERKKNKITLKELAGKINLSYSYLSQIENGQRNASTSTLRDLSKALSLDYDYLLYLAGHYTLNEYEHRKVEADYLQSDESIESEEFSYKLQFYKESKYVQLEDFLSGHRELYVNESKLSVEKIKHLIGLLNNGEKNYPSDETIEKELKLREFNEERMNKGKSFRLFLDY